MSAATGESRGEVEDLFEKAPCGYLTTAPDGTIRRCNETLAASLGLDREELVGRRRFVDLLAPAARIYHETHFAPLLLMQGSVEQVAMELIRADGSPLSALVNSVLVGGPEDPREIRTVILDAGDRRLYEKQLLRARREEGEIARRLQESLLAGALPEADGLAFGVGYRPAVGGLQVGGDWYDAFWLDEARIALVVGDVVGRGIEAATTMGQLRSATRALASVGPGPAGVLELLDEHARRHGIGMMTTVVYAEIDLRADRLRYACAGHMAPLLVDRDGRVEAADEGRSLPLAVLRAPRRRPEGRRALADLGLLALYTDGLIERRDGSLDAGQARLGDALRRHRDEPPATLVDEVLRELRAEGEAPDDSCLMVVSFEQAGAAAAV